MTIEIRAERSGDVWVLESSNGAVSQVADLAEVESEMQEAVAHLAGVPASDITLKVVH